MISGSFSVAGKSMWSADRMPLLAEEGDLTYHPVSFEGFSGGYFLHDRLPVSDNDIYYHDEEADIAVLFSGYIYNRAGLAGTGGVTGTEPEPRLAACLFLDAGPGFVSRLNGDFAIFICRPRRKQAYLFRDQTGVRPMAYSAGNGRLVFSTDITGLSRVSGDGEGPDTDFLLGFFKYVDYTQLPCRRVSKLLPGHYLEFSAAGLKMIRYWKPERIRTDHGMDYDVMISELKRLVYDAVAIRCDSRFNAGAHVSSGLDSGIVSTLARQHYASQESFCGFSWSPRGFSPDDVSYDERKLVQSLCLNAGITPVLSDIEAPDFLRYLSDFHVNKGYFIEESVLETAAKKRVNMIFSGWGGDEFISTGDRGIETDLLWGLHLRTYFRRNPVKPVRRFIKYFLHYTLYPALGILQGSVVRSFGNDTRYIKKPYKRSKRRALRNFYFHISRRQLHLRYLKFYHLQERCESWTVAGYRKGIEYRYPMLDRRIIEYMLKVPSLLLCKTDHFRPLLRVIGEGILPEEVRMNISKRDPVFSVWWEELMRMSSVTLMEEAGRWKDNSDLCFVNFDLLLGDISRAGKEAEEVNMKVLNKALVYIKAVNEFSKWYHEH
jgi:asparagine synthase (glutamine-hydrolysing)